MAAFSDASMDHDIDLAERFLISAMFESAGTAAISVLRRLVKFTVHHGQSTVTALENTELQHHEATASKNEADSGVLFETRTRIGTETGTGNSTNDVRETKTASRIDSVTEAGAGTEEGVGGGGEAEASLKKQHCGVGSSFKASDEMAIHKSEDICDFINAAGAVLVQSFHEMNRHAELVEVMRDIFQSTTSLPGELLLTWVALQLSADESSLAQTTLEDYLSKVPSSACDLNLSPLTFEPASTDRSCNGDDSGCAVKNGFKESNKDIRLYYAAAAEMYAVDVLEKVHGDGKAALKWASEQSWLPKEMKQKIVRRVESAIHEARLCQPVNQSRAAQDHSATPGFSSSLKGGLRRDSVGAREGVHVSSSKLTDELGQARLLPGPRAGRGKRDELIAGKSGGKKVIRSEIMEADMVERPLEQGGGVMRNGENDRKAGVADETDRVIRERKWPVWLVVVGVWLQSHLKKSSDRFSEGRSITEVALHRGWRYILANRRTVLVAILSSLVSFSAVRERAILTRIWINFTRALRQGMVDLWQLAFTVNLNPLAAVQPFPSTMTTQMLRY